ncbi:MAG: cytochrome C [Desulfuromonadales bacterium]|nr:cytochrome C [Desulfuromonadales bacterium]
MQKVIVALLLALFSVPAVSVAQGGETVDEYRDIIENRCTSCHAAARIEQAMAEGSDITEILNKMQQMGAELTTRDKNILGVFWGSPLKAEKK